MPEDIDDTSVFKSQSKGVGWHQGRLFDKPQHELTVVREDKRYGDTLTQLVVKTSRGGLHSARQECEFLIYHPSSSGCRLCNERSSATFSTTRSGPHTSGRTAPSAGRGWVRSSPARRSHIPSIDMETHCAVRHSIKGNGRFVMTSSNGLSQNNVCGLITTWE